MVLLACKNYNALSGKEIFKCYIDVNNGNSQNKEASVMLASSFNGADFKVL
ncbi:hypothetical protein VCJ_002609 [Vibrio metoecus]|nr:hypothetical protein VCJ_002609 [Vibrio metoecus]